MITQPPSGIQEPRYSQRKYLLKKQAFKLMGTNIRIFDESGNNLMFFAHQKAFKLKEDIRVYADEAKTQELITIGARQIMDFSAAYDVRDARTGEKIGAYKRKGWKSMLRDNWIIMDANDKEIGQIQEESGFFALLRRFVDFAALLMPQAFDVDVAGSRAADFNQKFNPFLYQMVLEFTPDARGALDRRMGIAAAILLTAIEGRQG